MQLKNQIRKSYITVNLEQETKGMLIIFYS